MDLTLGQAINFVEHVSAPAKTATFLVGPPGIGKTQGLAELAAKMKLNFGYLLLASTPEEEVHGIFRLAPQGGVFREPIEVLRMACATPTLLLIDELTHAVASRQTAATSITNERRVGDAMLHPDTVVVCAGNGADFDGNHDMIPALRNRINWVSVRGDTNEVVNYLVNRVGEPGSTLRNLAVDYAYTSERVPSLIQLEQPDNAQLWASPRAIEQALREGAKALEAAQSGAIDPKLGQMLFRQAFEGRLGEEVAGAWLAIRKFREHLPSPKEIVAEPKKAKLPRDVDTSIAVLGVVGMAAEENADSAFIYATRIEDGEIQAALTNKILKKPVKSQEAIAARAKLLGKVGAALAGA